MAFFKIPQETRDTIYSHLTQRCEVDALIKSSVNGPPNRLVFYRVWIPHVLLISKKFTEEYFDEVCERHLVCMVMVGADDERPLTTERFVVNPASAMRALAKVRTLLGCGVVNGPESLALFSNSLADPKLPSLLSLMPNLKRYHEYLYVLNPSLQYTLGRGDTALLHALHQHHFGTQRMEKLQHLLQTQQGASRHITYKSGTFLADHFSCDPITQRGSWESWILYRATPVLQGEVKPEWCYHGLKLEPVRIKDEKGDVVLL